MSFEGNTWYITLIFSLIVAVAFLGNALVIFVLVNKSFYLKQPYNIFILNLAATDLTTAVMLVFSRYVYLPPMPFGKVAQDIYCKTIWNARIIFMLSYISVYTCLALTAERWLAVVKPLKYRAVKPSHAVKAIAGLWTWGVAINFGTMFRTKVNHAKQKCTQTPLDVANKELLWLDFVLQSAIPFAVIVILYSHILYTMLKLPNMGDCPRSVKRVTFVAFMASSMLIIGWMPGRIYLVLVRTGLIEKPKSFFLQYCFATMAFCNNCVNPFFYGIYSAQFRKEYKAIFEKILSPFKGRGIQALPTLPGAASSEKIINTSL